MKKTEMHYGGIKIVCVGIIQQDTDTNYICCHDDATASKDGISVKLTPHVWYSVSSIELMLADKAS